ncbi:MAG TPA: class I SAM-dependent methyltransferase [Propionibacteriaceae bacterium]
MNAPASGSGGQEAGKPEGGTFGVDAPKVPLALGAAALLLTIIACILMITHGFIPGLVTLIFGAFFALCALSYLYTTLHGKFVWWADLLDDARLKGNEYAVDLGCGRGAVMISLAKRLTTGRVSGIDLWRSQDQSGNDIEATKHNARSCGVEDRVELNTGNITTLPYYDGQFDLVVSSLAIHNLKAREDRWKAITEAVRVLEPGGKIIIADISHTDEYADWLSEAGMESVNLQDLGVRGWWGGPWMPTSAVTASRPGGRTLTA